MSLIILLLEILKYVLWRAGSSYPTHKPPNYQDIEELVQVIAIAMQFLVLMQA